MKTLWKIFLVIFITAIAVWVWCGGGAIIGGIIAPCKWSYCSLSSMWTSLWFLGSIGLWIWWFIWSIKNFQTLGELKKNSTQITWWISWVNIDSAKEMKAGNLESFARITICILIFCAIVGIWYVNEMP